MKQLTTLCSPCVSICTLMHPRKVTHSPHGGCDWHTFRPLEHSNERTLLAMSCGPLHVQLILLFSLLFSAVATPKQIRELMKVQGLTNDEVKSHLQVKIHTHHPSPITHHPGCHHTIPYAPQKYRLYTRRPSGPAAPSHPSPAHKPLVVLGGVWVPPDFASPLTASGDLSGARHLRPTYPHELYG